MYICRLPPLKTLMLVFSEASASEDCSKVSSSSMSPSTHAWCISRASDWTLQDETTLSQQHHKASSQPPALTEETQQLSSQHGVIKVDTKITTQCRSPSDTLMGTPENNDEADPAHASVETAAPFGQPVDPVTVGR